MVRLEVIDANGRGAADRARALGGARDQADARRRLAEVVEALAAAETTLDDTTKPSFWRELDRAYACLDAYLDGLLAAAEVEPRCRPGCATCCTDAPPVFAIEGARMRRALRGRPDGPARLARAAEQARAFAELLRQRGLGPDADLAEADPAEADLADPGYRQAQLEWRRAGHRCPILADDGRCSAYAARPLACRVHVHVEEPARCDPGDPGFSTAERPPVWGHPREAEVELALARISERLDLGPPTSLQHALADRSGVIRR